MRRVTAVLSAAAVAVVMVVGLSAQNTKFNGKWTRDADKTTAANPAPPAGGAAAGGGGGRGGAGGGGGARGAGGGAGAFTLAVDATSLTRTPEAGMNGAAPVAQVYKLDGADHDMPMGQATAKVKAKWDDSKTTIVIETTRDNNGTSSTTKAVYSIDGDWLVIANTNAAGTTTKTYYKKA